MMMNIRSFEPTPSPNVMKLILEQPLHAHEKYEFEPIQISRAPEWLQPLLALEGVRSIYAITDFVALERQPNVDWRTILMNVPGISADHPDLQKFTSAITQQTSNEQELEQEFQVFVQMIQHIPIQIKLVSPTQEFRYALAPEIVTLAVQESRKGDNLIRDRIWLERGVRYGIPEELGVLLVEEESIVFRQVTTLSTDEATTTWQTRWSNTASWQERYAMLSKTTIEMQSLNIFLMALKDAHPSIRRLAVVYLAELKDPLVFAYLFKALRDPAVSVRRTAGDALSDLGDPIAIPYMIEALKDVHKLMRWRAARYLYEVGDERALPALEEALHDPEYEVSLQANRALTRIAGGEKANGTIWQQIANRSKNVQ